MSDFIPDSFTAVLISLLAEGDLPLTILSASSPIAVIKEQQRITWWWHAWFGKTLIAYVESQRRFWLQNVFISGKNAILQRAIQIFGPQPSHAIRSPYADHAFWNAPRPAAWPWTPVGTPAFVPKAPVKRIHLCNYCQVLGHQTRYCRKKIEDKRNQKLLQSHIEQPAQSTANIGSASPVPCRPPPAHSQLGALVLPPITRHFFGYPPPLDYPASINEDMINTELPHKRRVVRRHPTAATANNDNAGAAITIRDLLQASLPVRSDTSTSVPSDTLSDVSSAEPVGKRRRLDTLVDEHLTTAAVAAAVKEREMPIILATEEHDKTTSVAEHRATPASSPTSSLVNPLPPVVEPIVLGPATASATIRKQPTKHHGGAGIPVAPEEEGNIIILSSPPATKTKSKSTKTAESKTTSRKISTLQASRAATPNPVEEDPFFIDEIAALMALSSSSPTGDVAADTNGLLFQMGLL